jgi:hypothetical protein
VAQFPGIDHEGGARVEAASGSPVFFGHGET